MSVHPSAPDAGADVAVVRYFAAAKAATGVAEEARTVGAGQAIGELLSTWGPEHARLFGRCSFILNGVATTDPASIIRGGDTLDVLPPFAGG